MSVKKNREELLRLKNAFEEEAARFHDTQFSVLYFTQEEPLQNERYRRPNHVVMLWQYWGALEESTTEQLADDVFNSDRVWGIRGSKFSAMALIEGEQTDLFVRMAKRAGSIFSQNEALRIRMRAGNDFKSNLPPQKSVFVANDNALAVWLNRVLYEMRTTHPGYVPGTEVRVAIDPFAASLRTIDRLLASGSKARQRRDEDPFGKRRFRVSLSFPGTQRDRVSEVAKLLEKEIPGQVFYDGFFAAQLARPNLDNVLTSVYRERSDLIVVFLCKDYAASQWCGLEWRSVRDLIKHGPSHKIMLLRLDDEAIEGLLSIDGYLDIRSMDAVGIRDAILSRQT